MKKTIKLNANQRLAAIQRIAIIAIAAVMALAFTTCEGAEGPMGPQGETGQTGGQGPQGETGGWGDPNCQHEYVTIEIAKPSPTQTTDGKYVKRCTDCPYQEYYIIPAFNKLYGTWVCTDYYWGDFTITISTNTIGWEAPASTSWNRQYANIQQDRYEVNINTTYENEYPVGFSFTGTKTGTSSSITDFGFIACSADFQKIYVGIDASERAFDFNGYGCVFTKQ